MSPFAAIFDRRRTPLEPFAVEALENALGKGGEDGSRGVRVVTASAGFVAARSIAASPVMREEACQEGCLGAEGLGARQLSGSFGLETPASSVGKALVDGLERLGGDIWARIDGSFGLVLFDPSRHTLYLACDRLGSRTLFFSEEGGLVLVADRIETLLRWGRKTRSLDPDQLVRFFGLESPRSGRTYFRGIQEVEPGSAIHFTVGGCQKYRFRLAASDEPSPVASDAEHAHRFRERLREATSRLLGASDRLGIMLSGGIDSTTLAVLAAGQAATGKGAVTGRLAACSWIFDELASCDERPGIETTLAAHDFEVIQVSGDGCWPLVDPELFSTLPGVPEENPYRALKSALYCAARDQGRSLLFNGGAADIFYRGGTLYLRDLLLEGRWGTAIRGLARQITHSGGRSAAGSVARIVRPTGRRKVRRPPPEWLTGDAKRRWRAETASSPPVDRDPRDVIPYLATESRGLAIENLYAAQQGVRVASPYWTREWVEFMLSLPAHQVYRPGTTKFIAREAMRGVIPEPVRVRQQPTLLDPLFDRGVFERETKMVDDLLHGRGSVWKEFVDPSFVAGLGPDSPSAHKVVLWNCLSFELWRRKYGWEVA